MTTGKVVAISTLTASQGSTILPVQKSTLAKLVENMKENQPKEKPYRLTEKEIEDLRKDLKDSHQWAMEYWRTHQS